MITSSAKMPALFQHNGRIIMPNISHQPSVAMRPTNTFTTPSSSNNYRPAKIGVSRTTTHMKQSFGLPQAPKHVNVSNINTQNFYQNMPAQFTMGMDRPQTLRSGIAPSAHRSAFSGMNASNNALSRSSFVTKERTRVKAGAAARRS